jgi:vacuolar-type H+-ATPase subunit F/Vma7
MNDRVRVLCRPAIAAGFRLAGMRADLAEDAAAGAGRLAALLEDPTVGVVLVQEDFYAALPEAQHHTLSRRPLPMVVPFPAPSAALGARAPDAFIAELLRQAIGYRVRLG